MLQAKQDLVPLLLQNGFSQKDVDRFLTKIDDSGGAEACWEWQGGTFKSGGGYGAYWLKGKTHTVSRLVCAAVHKIPSGMFALHSCDNPLCCNPNHLSPGTDAENKQEAAQRLRVGMQKLTPSDVHAIRCWLQGGYTQQEIADAFEVNYRTISDIKRGYTWHHLKDENTSLRHRRKRPLPQRNQTALHCGC